MHEFAKRLLDRIRILRIERDLAVVRFDGRIDELEAVWAQLDNAADRLERESDEEPAA